MKVTAAELADLEVRVRIIGCVRGAATQARFNAVADALSRLRWEVGDEEEIPDSSAAGALQSYLAVRAEKIEAATGNVQ